MKAKLTPKQNEVIWCLQNGAVLITDSTMTGAWVGFTRDSPYNDFHTNNGVLFRLVAMDLVYQDLQPPFNYVLTWQGKELKTTKPKHYD